MRSRTVGSTEFWSVSLHDCFFLQRKLATPNSAPTIGIAKELRMNPRLDVPFAPTTSLQVRLTKLSAAERHSCTAMTETTTQRNVTVMIVAATKMHFLNIGSMLLLSQA